MNEPAEVETPPAPAIPRGFTAADLVKQVQAVIKDIDLRKWCVGEAMKAVTSPGVTVPAENGVSIVAADIYKFVTAALPHEKTASPEKP